MCLTCSRIDDRERWRPRRRGSFPFRDDDRDSGIAEFGGQATGGFGWWRRRTDLRGSRTRIAPAHFARYADPVDRTEPPEHEHTALYERGIYLRGLFIQRYAAVEFSVTHLLMLCRQHPAYNPLGDLPFKLSSKLKRLKTILGMDGPVTPFARELRAMVDLFVQLEEDRHFLAHGLMATKLNDQGKRIIAFRLYNHIGGEVHSGGLDLPIDKLGDLAGLLHPTASDFSALVSKIGREALFPQWQAMGGDDAMPPIQGEKPS